MEKIGVKAQRHLIAIITAVLAMAWGTDAVAQTRSHRFALEGGFGTTGPRTWGEGPYFGARGYLGNHGLFALFDVSGIGNGIVNEKSMLYSLGIGGALRRSEPLRLLYRGGTKVLADADYYRLWFLGGGIEYGRDVGVLLIVDWVPIFRGRGIWKQDEWVFKVGVYWGR